MRLEAIENIKNYWSNLDINAQESFILQYLGKHGQSDMGNWLDLLADEFGTGGNNEFGVGGNRLRFLLIC